MKIQFASDLHLEFPENRQYLRKNPLVPSAEILVLAGDITPLNQKDDHNDFFSWLSDHNRQVYYLLGNHEYDHFDMVNQTGGSLELVRPYNQAGDNPAWL